MKNTSVALALALLFGVSSSPTQASPVFGALSNFDVFNDTGEVTHGFEIELHGCSSSDIYSTFTGQRYGLEASRKESVDAGGAPVVTIRYESPYSAAYSKYVISTPIPSAMTVGAACYSFAYGSPAYAVSGCEHFGVRFVNANKNPTSTVYRWLVADPSQPGTLVAAPKAVTIPAPTYSVSPPANPAVNSAPVVAVVIPAPPVEVETHLQYGDAQWVKVFKMESAQPADLNALQSDNPVAVPMDAAQVETEWKIMQTGPAGVNNEAANEAPLGAGNQSVTRRYEFYRYTGAYDLETHEIMCMDGSCNVPDPSEIGDFIGAQMTAVNLDLPRIVASSNLAKGEVGIDYGSQTLVSGGTQPYDIVVSGALPDGLSLDLATGVLSGMSTTAGSSSFSIVATDADGFVVDGSFSLTIASPVSISTTSLPSATVGKAYSTKLAAANGVSPYTWALTSGTLPAGLGFSAGTISGTPSVAASVTLGFTVSDGVGARSQKTLGLTVASAPVSCTKPSGATSADGKGLITEVGSGYIKIGPVKVNYLNCTTMKFNDVPPVFVVGMPAQWKGYSLNGAKTATALELN